MSVCQPFLRNESYVVNTLQSNTQLPSCLLTSITNEYLEFTNELTFITYDEPTRKLYLEYLVFILPFSRECLC